jgi:hypothetical protein
VSAKQKLSPHRIRGQFIVCLLLGFLLACLPISSKADSLEDAAHTFARKIAQMLTPGEKLTVTLHNLSSLSADQVLSFEQAVEDDLRGRGHNVLHTESGETSLKIGLSQSLTSLFAVAELVQSGQTRVFVERLDLATLDLFAGTTSKQLSLSSELVWKQSGPIRDLRFLAPDRDEAERLVILGLEAISVHQKGQTGWSVVKTYPLRTGDAQSRDPRGQLFEMKEDSGFRLVAGLPGLTCFVSLDAAFNPGNLECDSNPKDELVGASVLTSGPHLIDAAAKWDSSHNYFTGDIFGESGTKLRIDPFYSATFYSSNSGESPEALVVSGIDGQCRVFNHDGKVLRTLSLCGSELTTVHSDCDDGWYILASGKGDWTSSDRVTALQLEEGSVRVFEQFVELPGPVLSLGSEQIPSEGDIKFGPKGAIAVIRNLKSGEYEAYRISIACSQ